MFLFCCISLKMLSTYFSFRFALFLSYTNSLNKKIEGFFNYSEKKFNEDKIKPYIFLKILKI